MIVNAIALICLFANIKLFIKRTINVVKLTIIKIRFQLHLRVSEKCVNAGSEEMEAYLQELIDSVDFATRSLSVVGSVADAEKMFAQLDSYNIQLEENRDKYDKVNRQTGLDKIRISKALVVLAVLILIVNHPSVVNFVIERILDMGNGDYL